MILNLIAAIVIAIFTAIVAVTFNADKESTHWYLY